MNTEDAGTGINKAGRCKPYDMVFHDSTSSGKKSTWSVTNKKSVQSVAVDDDMCSLRFQTLFCMYLLGHEFTKLHVHNFR